MKKRFPRRFERSPYLCNVIVRPLQDGRPFSAHVLNLSRTGLKLFSERVFLEPGKFVDLVFSSGGDIASSCNCHLIGRCVWSHAELDGNFIGMEFSEHLSTSQVGTLFEKTKQEHR